ncbi:MAG: HAMP domain-containing sensor histidine kinase [Candidatus Izemoplasmatales bacterium]|nr:HAMP domain-containing sensor histidine kinase [Candidatus Izemoplasmatales bacterium]
MTIRKKLLIYYGVFLVISYGIAAILTGVLIRSGLNRLLYSNIANLNDNIVNTLEASGGADFYQTLNTARELSGVDLLVYQSGFVYYTSFSSQTLDLEKASLASEKYNVYRIIDNFQYYYFTQGSVDDGLYTIYVFRDEGSLMEQNQTIFLMSFIGIVFLAISISLISIFSAKTFAEPAQRLAAYVNNLSFQNRPIRRPKFNILEYEELSEALEQAHLRVYQYSQSEQEFLHNFSHEMKTPLTNIYSYAEAMYYGVLSKEEIQNTSEIIMHESEKLKDFINQVLYLGRLDSIGEVLNVSRINLVDIIGDALNTVDIQAKEKSLKIVFMHDQEDVYIYGDADKLEVALVNLVINAIRYAKTTVIVHLILTKEDIVITIDDDGMGIDEDIRDQIWERYFIGKEGHTGLGLTITKAIIEKHQAEISVGDNAMHGARFTIRFILSKKIIVSL